MQDTSGGLRSCIIGKITSFSARSTLAPGSMVSVRRAFKLSQRHFMRQSQGLQRVC